MSMYDKTHYNTVISLQLIKKIKKKSCKKWDTTEQLSMHTRTRICMYMERERKKETLAYFKELTHNCGGLASLKPTE